MKKLTTLLFVLLAGGCSDAPETDLEGLKAMRDQWQMAFDGKDPVALAALYAENGAVLPPNDVTVKGRAAIEGFWTEFLASGISGEIRDTDVYAHGDVGYKVGAFTISDPGGATIDTGKYIEIWRHVDGRWQLQHDIHNSDMPLPAPPPAPEPEDEAEVIDDEAELVDDDGQI